MVSVEKNAAAQKAKSSPQLSSDEQGWCSDGETFNKGHNSMKGKFNLDKGVFSWVYKEADGTLK